MSFGENVRGGSNMKIRSFNLDDTDLLTLQRLGHSQNFKNESEVVRFGLKLVRGKYNLKFSPDEALPTKKSKQAIFITADSSKLMQGFEHFLAGKMSSEELGDYERERAVEGMRYKIEDWWILNERSEQLEKLKEEFKTKHRG